MLSLAREDEDFILTFVAKSTEDLESYLQNVKAASASANLPLLLFQRHKSKTLLALLGDSTVTGLLDTVVEKAKSSDWEHTSEILRLEIEIRGLIFKVNSELITKNRLL